MTQAPSVNFVTRDHDRDDAGGDGADAVDERGRAPARLLDAEVALGHAGLREGEAR